MAEELALYMTPICPFCHRVQAVIEGLNMEVELRDTLSDPRHRQDLIAARGRATVPVLRITDAAGQDVWLPESQDIIAYLQRR